MTDKKNNTGVDNSGNRNSGDWNSGNWNSGDRNTGNGNSGYGNSGDWNSGNRNSGDWNSGNWNSGDRNTGNGNSGYGNSGNRNSGYGNSGNWNSGNWNSGCFNTDEPLARFFNRESNVKLSEFYNSDACPDFSEMNPCVWVEESMMTTEEKKEFPSYKTTGGYLKKLEYKDAWGVFWRKTTEENKKKVLSLPNFDASIFKEITGIDVNQNSEAKQKATELRKKADELLKSAEALEASL